MLGFQNTKTFLQKETLRTGQKKFIRIKDTVPWTYVISDLNGKLITGSFYEKKLQKTSQEKLIIEKIIKTKKMINCTSNGKNTMIRLIVGLIKKILNEIPSHKNESILS